MKKQDMKVLELKIQEVTGLQNVELIPSKVTKLENTVTPSVDVQLLEMENRLNALRIAKTPRMAKKEQRIATKANFMNKAMEALDSVLDVIEEPMKLLNIKGINKVANYFFLLEDDEDEVVTPQASEAPITPAVPDVVKEGKVVYVNFNR